MSIAEQMTQKKFLFQFINHENGQRSEPFAGNWETVKYVLDERQEGQMPRDEDYILLVAVMDGEETIVPATPLIHVKTAAQFLGMDKEKFQEEVENG